jgi:hypothetical protein
MISFHVNIIQTLSIFFFSICRHFFSIIGDSFMIAKPRPYQCLTENLQHEFSFSQYAGKYRDQKLHYFPLKGDFRLLFFYPVRKLSLC